MAKRSTKAKTRSAGDRALESKAARLAAGYVRKDLLLPPAAAADLAALTERDECTEAEAIEAALRVARGRNAEPSNTELARLVARRLKGAAEPS
jgi:hypothetical protein